MGGDDERDGPRAHGAPATGRSPGGRWIGVHPADRPGPLLVCVGGVHGNEPAGVAALRRVLGEIRREDETPIKGTFVALAGNVGALEESVRYRSRDLNRQWTDPRTAELRRSDGGPPSLGPEGREQRSLLRILEETLEEERRGPAFLLDLHTTSGESPPFAIVGRREACRRFAREFPIPRVHDLGRHLPGMLSDWACRRGFAAMTAEAGQHAASTSVDRHRAIAWTALSAAGLVPEDAPRAARARRLLAAASEGVPRRLEVRYRHPVAPGNGFRMKPGLKNFDHVRKGRPIAEDEAGEIPAPRAGLLFLPLYQELGSDGFFIVRAAAADRNSKTGDTER